MRINLDTLIKYLWLALIAVVIVAVIFVVILPSSEARSVCTGFQYFVFLSQKMTESSYQVELLNGPRDIAVKGWSVNEIKMNSDAGVKAGDSFILTSGLDPTSQKSGEAFSYQFWLDYDMKDGIKGNRDTATCTGRVQ